RAIVVPRADATRAPHALQPWVFCLLRRAIAACGMWNLSHAGRSSCVDTEKPMKCPTCPDSTLSMTDRQGIEIDYCPQCRGVWLDRGELDKLIERAASPAAAAQAPAAPQAAARRPDFV